MIQIAANRAAQQLPNICGRYVTHWAAAPPFNESPDDPRRGYALALVPDLGLDEGVSDGRKGCSMARLYGRVLAFTDEL